MVTLEEALARRDWSSLRRLSLEPGGFRSDEFRRRIYPLLLSPAATQDTPFSVQEHPDAHQVDLDVRRTFFFLNNDEHAQSSRRQQLKTVIMHVLNHYPALHYFQGYHDVISVLLLVLDDVEATKQCAESISLYRLRDNMTRTLEPTMGYLRILRRLLQAANPELAALTDQCVVWLSLGWSNKASRLPTLPYFSWVLTLLSHDVDSQVIVARFFDCLLTHNPVFVVYLAVAIVIKKQEGTEWTTEALEDPGLLHHFLSKVPKFVLEDVPRRQRTTSQDSLSTTDLSASLTSNAASTTSSHSHKHLLESICTDPDVDISGLSTASASQPSQTSETSSPTPRAVSVEETIQLAAALWRRYPLDSPEIQARHIMGPQSVIFTWHEGPPLMTPTEAQAIVKLGGKAIVLPGVLDGLDRPRRRVPKLYLWWLRARRANVGSVILVTAVLALVLATYKPAGLQRTAWGQWVSGAQGMWQQFWDALR